MAIKVNYWVILIYNLFHHFSGLYTVIEKFARANKSYYNHKIIINILFMYLDHRLCYSLLIHNDITQCMYDGNYASMTGSKSFKKI